jgi:HAMP domain-containing protein
VTGSKRWRTLSPAISAVLCLLALAQQAWPRVTFWGAWTLLGLVFLYQDRRRPDPDRLDPETLKRAARRGALLNSVASVVCFGSATLLPEHPTTALLGGAVFAFLGGLCLWAASFWTTSRGQLRLERLRQQEALKKGSQTEPAAASPAGQTGTTWQDPPYFSSS